MALRPGWFPEYSPAQQIVFDDIVKIIEKHYKQFGYTHIHTPAVESNAVLLSKNGEETGKQIFWLYGLAQGAEDLKDYALHFDLTVPFARYVLDREHELTFPFKRYQIQPVRRGERAQKGRYREFRQCDVDVIRKDDKKADYLYYDAEVILDLYKAIREIIVYGKLDDEPIFHINNKKIVNGLLIALFKTPELKQQVSTLIDKYNKIGEEKFVLSLKELDINDREIEKLLQFLHIDIKHEKDVLALKGVVKSEEFDRGLDELITVMKYLDMFNETMWWVWYIVDFKIVRWLDYYTWTVFECYVKNDIALGSICGGGRYDNLTGYIDSKKKDYCGVGGSIGISRILGKLFEKENTFHEQKTVTEYLFVNFPETIKDVFELAGVFINEGKNIEIYPFADKLGKQFAYADKKWIPHVVIFGEGEKALNIYKIKEMKTGNEREISL